MEQNDETQNNTDPEIRYVLLSEAYELLWKDNKKLHDIGSMIQSIEKYGWQELPKYDATLGAIKAGNGRIESLWVMERENYELPRGVRANESGEWVVPILFGVDALTPAEAKAYAIDSNNLTIAGGDFDLSDHLALWDTDFETVLFDIAAEGEIPIVFDADVIDRMMKQAERNEDKEPSEAEEHQDSEENNAACYCCKKDYSDFGVDTTIPNLQWNTISPRGDGGGLLCASCMVERASKMIPGVLAARMVFEIIADNGDGEKSDAEKSDTFYTDAGWKE